MLFDDTDLDDILDGCGAVTVTTKLSGVTFGTFPAVFKESTRIESPFETGETILRPTMTCKTSSLEGVERGYTFEIAGNEYKAFGGPEKQSSGLSVQVLVKK